VIIEIVTFPQAAGADRAATLEDAKHTIPKWSSNPDLVAKHFLMGVGEASNIGAGVYIWPSIEAARSAHDDAWRESVKKRSGGYPEIRYFDMILKIDNVHGEITQYAADGTAQPCVPAHA
jgi:hypothetical protein